MGYVIDGELVPSALLHQLERWATPTRVRVPPGPGFSSGAPRAYHDQTEPLRKGKSGESDGGEPCRCKSCNDISNQYCPISLPVMGLRLVLLCNLLIAGQLSAQNDTDPKEMEYADGTSVEPAYLLPHVNITTPRADGFPHVNSVPATLSRVLNFYNTEILAAQWEFVKKSLSSGCQDDMEKYLEALAAGSLWALKSKQA